MNRTVYLLPLNRSGKFLFLILACLLFFNQALEAQNLKADYQFQGNLNSSVAGAPAMSNLTGSGENFFQHDVIDGYTRQTVRFPFNSGLSVNMNGVIPNNAYTIVMLLRVDETSGFRRLVSFDNGTTDDGAYIFDGRIELEGATNAQFFPNTHIQIAIVRDATGEVRIYRDGILSVHLENDGGEFQITTDNILRFFQDDVLMPTEATAGNIARIRLYDAPMSISQIRLLERLPNASGGGGRQDILFTSTRDGNKEVYVMNSDGSNQRRLTFNSLDSYDAKWSTDKTKIAFTRNEWIWIMNADGSGAVRLTNTGAFDHAPEWMPLSTRIVFSRCNGSNVCDLYTMNMDGSGVQMMQNGINTAGNEDRADFSMVSNNDRIVFQCSGSSPSVSNICEAGTSGSNRRFVTNHAAPMSDATPTYVFGRIILFRRLSNIADNLSGDIYTMHANGEYLTNLTNTPNMSESSPFYSFFNSKIVYAGRSNGTADEIYSADATNGSGVQRLTNNSVSDVPSDVHRFYLFADYFGYPAFDFDGDGRGDAGIYRPSSSEWWIQKSSDNQSLAVQFGQSGDKFVPADYTGDRKADIAVFRPSNGFWYILRSENNTFYGTQFGTKNDTPVPGDYDGDGRDDIAVHRASNNGWYILRSYAGFAGLQFGSSGDIPVPADFDGDHRTDIAVYRPNGANGSQWWFRGSDTNDVIAVQFGTAGDIPLAYDFTGDSKADFAFWRPSTGMWYVLRSHNNTFYGFQFGAPGDIPAPGDYDGDLRTDAAIFRPTDATWYILRSTAGMQTFNYGLPTDKPLQSAYVR